MVRNTSRFLVMVGLLGVPVLAADFAGLSRLTPGRVRTENGLWIETPLDRQFKNSKTVTVAEMQGPGVVTMIHFALPQLSVADAKYKMNRDTLIQMYWDGEATPSVNVPFADFFCDPMGERDVVNAALVNKRRGWNAYFPMPFRKSAKIVLAYEGPEALGEKLWNMMPCYSYVIWRQTAQTPDEEGYFHAQWRQEGVLSGKADYAALEAKGRGKFVGWNVSVRRPGTREYPVDMNEKFYIDGEKAPSVEFQGIEDSFGYSWGFPESESAFPLTGYWPFMMGATAYRFFVNDAISFDESLKVAIGYGVNEHPMFREQFSRPGTQLQFSSTCYWYQTEPHAAFPPMLKASERGPAPEQLFWPEDEKLPTPEAFRARGVRLEMLCGRLEKEVIFAEAGFNAKSVKGHRIDTWPSPVYHCRTQDKELKIEVTVPKGESGKLRIYIIDPDNFEGGRKQSMAVNDRDLGTFEGFQQGKWIETDVPAEATAQGRLMIHAINLRDKSNVVISIIEWVTPK